MSRDCDAVDGVDAHELVAFVDSADENPAAVRLGLAARATYEGTCAHSLARVDSYTLGDELIARETREYATPYGGWKEVLDAGGWIDPTDRLAPVESALAALAACINAAITINAVANGVDVEWLQTRVRAEVDPAVLLGLEGLEEADTVFENLVAEIEIEGQSLDEDLIDEWARRAPVYTLASLAQDVELTVISETVDD